MTDSLPVPSALRSAARVNEAWQRTLRLLCDDGARDETAQFLAVNQGIAHEMAELIRTRQRGSEFVPLPGMNGDQMRRMLASHVLPTVYNGEVELDPAVVAMLDRDYRDHAGDGPAAAQLITLPEIDGRGGAQYLHRCEYKMLTLADLLRLAVTMRALQPCEVIIASIVGKRLRQKAGILLDPSCTHSFAFEWRQSFAPLIRAREDRALVDARATKYAVYAR